MFFVHLETHVCKLRVILESCVLYSSTVYIVQYISSIYGVFSFVVALVVRCSTNSQKKKLGKRDWYTNPPRHTRPPCTAVQQYVQQQLVSTIHSSVFFFFACIVPGFPFFHDPPLSRGASSPSPGGHISTPHARRVGRRRPSVRRACQGLRAEGLGLCRVGLRAAVVRPRGCEGGGGPRQSRCPARHTETEKLLL